MKYLGFSATLVVKAFRTLDPCRQTDMERGPYVHLGVKHQVFCLRMKEREKIKGSAYFALAFVVFARLQRGKFVFERPFADI